MKNNTKMLHIHPVLAENQPFTQQIYQTSVFRMPSYNKAVKSENEIKPSSYYNRWGNPTTCYLEEQLCSLSGYKRALIFPTGMSAITMTILALLEPGDTIIVSSRLYGDTLRFFIEELPKFKIDVHFFDVTSIDSLIKFSDVNYQLIFFEALSNPDLILPDIDRILEIAREKNAKTLCDATLAPPGILLKSNINPDIILQSLTKYIGGHSASSGGAVLASDKLLTDKIWQKQALYGAAIDPHAAWLISQGLMTLEIRLEKQSESALKIAKFLNNHPLVEFVSYPMLEESNQYNFAMIYLNAGGGVITFSLKGGNSSAIQLLEKTKIIILAVSLGDVKSSIEHAQSMSHSMLNVMDISKVCNLFNQLKPEDNLIRLSIGIEDVDDLIEDLNQALNSISAA